MPATALTATTPYVPWETRKVYIMDSVADVTAPTRLELDAGTDISPQLTELTGFTRTGSFVESQSFVGAALKLAGPASLDDSAFTCRLSKTSTDIRDVVEYGDIKYIAVFPDGDTTGRKFNSFKVQINGDPDSQGITDPATKTYNCAVLAAEFGIAVPS